MAKNIIDKKYYALIWVSLIFASLIANAYSIYLGFVEMETITRSAVILNIMVEIFSKGLIPAGFCFFVSFIIYAIGIRRGITPIPRNDFVYTVMAFTAGARVVCGVIEIFCIIVPRMYVITSAVLSPVVLTVTYAVMFFLVFAKRYNLNPVEKYNVFRLWATIYLIVLGVSVVFQNALYLAVFNDEELLALVNSALLEYEGYVLVKDSLQTAASAIALSAYGVFVIVAVVLGELMRKQANRLQNPETRGEYFDSQNYRPYDMRDDVTQTYSEFGEPYEHNDSVHGEDKNGKDDNSSGSGNVFDEFDM